MTGKELKLFVEASFWYKKYKMTISIEDAMNYIGEHTGISPKDDFEKQIVAKAIKLWTS